MSNRGALKTTAKRQQPVAKVAKGPSASGMPSKRSESSQSIASDSKTRRHLTSVLDINISQARCHRHLKQNLSDGEVAQEIKSLRDLLKENPNVEKVAKINAQVKELRKKQRENPAEKDELQAQINKLLTTLKETPNLQSVVETTLKINELTKKMVRLSSEVSVVLATVCDFIIEDIITFAMECVIANNKKQIKPPQLVAPGIEKTKSYPFIRNLSVFVQEQTKFRDEQSKETTTEDAAAAPQGGEPETPEQAGTDDSEGELEDPEFNNNNFVTYVHNAINKVKLNQQEKFGPIRISKPCRKYLSNLIICFIKRISNLAQIIVTMCDVRTLTPDHVINIIQWILRDEQAPEAVFQEVRARVDSKLELYRVHCTTVKTTDDQ
jgi:hypothetical protein